MNEMAAPVQTIWVTVKAPSGETAGVVITRSCCAFTAARKAVDIAFPDREGQPQYPVMLQGIYPWLLIPDTYRERLLNLAEVTEVNKMLAAQQTTTPTMN
jgi:hypothetical protein